MVERPNQQRTGAAGVPPGRVEPCQNLGPGPAYSNLAERSAGGRLHRQRRQSLHAFWLYRIAGSYRWQRIRAKGSSLEEYPADGSLWRRAFRRIIESAVYLVCPRWHVAPL